jgi:hypothetical protein
MVEQSQAAGKLGLDSIGGPSQLDKVLGERGVGQLSHRLRGTAVESGMKLGQGVGAEGGFDREHLYVYYRRAWARATLNVVKRRD